MSIIKINNLSKVYDDGTKALSDVNLEINQGEIFALLGPNGAGKTTLINITCGLVNISSGSIEVDGHDVASDYRQARSCVSLVPQELNLDPFITARKTLEYARGFFGKEKNDKLVEETLKGLSLWEKRDKQVRQLSGGMKRRVLIGKALMNEPKVLFLDEPTAGVDVELRRGMWEFVEKIKNEGTTIILTTHYLEEAEAMANRVGIINKGKLQMVEEKETLMKKFGKKELVLTLEKELESVPQSIGNGKVSLDEDKKHLRYVYEDHDKEAVVEFLNKLQTAKINFVDMNTQQSSLEDIFVDLIS